MTTALLLIFFALCLMPLVAAPFFKTKTGRKISLYCNIAAVIILAVAVMATPVAAADEAQEAIQSEAVESTAGGLSLGDGLGMLGIALVTGMSCIGAGIAVSTSATAAIGAISENAKTFGKALIFVALAEGVALYGMLISIQMLAKI